MLAFRIPRNNHPKRLPPVESVDETGTPHTVIGYHAWKAKPEGIHHTILVIDLDKD